MKRWYNIFILIFVLGLFDDSCFAQSAFYKDGMKKQVSLFNAATGKTDLLKLAGVFTTIAIAEKTQWIPYYYAGLCNVAAAFEMDKTDVDGQCDKSESLIKKADSLSPANSEIEVLKAMLAAARITVNEKKRGLTFGSACSKYANNAIKLNADNPRAYLLKGRALLYTPEVFGGGYKKAKSHFDNAVEKYKIFKPSFDFAPVWGREEVEKELQKIRKQQKK